MYIRSKNKTCIDLIDAVILDLTVISNKNDQESLETITKLKTLDLYWSNTWMGSPSDCL